MLTVFSNISLLIFIKAHADRWETVKIEHLFYMDDIMKLFLLYQNSVSNFMYFTWLKLKIFRIVF